MSLLEYEKEIQYLVNDKGEPKSVLIPIEIWEEISSEIETKYLLSNDIMKKRLLEAKERGHGIPWENVRENLGI
ncbi:MAG: prevent-host-death protein [Candidatus Eremiobacterota bacterium]